MKVIVDLDGGDFGLSEGNTKIESIPFLVMRVAGIFSSLRTIKPRGKIFSYCISFNSDYFKTIEAMLIDIEREGLPEGVSFYEFDGKKIFEIRGASGGVTASTCFYLIYK